MTIHCKCDHLFSYKTFRNGKLASETYFQDFPSIVETFPTFTLGQLNKLDTHFPVEHTVGNVHYEIKIQELADDRRRKEEVRP